MMDILKKISEWHWANNPMYISFAVHCIVLGGDKGNFTTTINILSKYTGIPHRQLRTIMKNCKEMGFIKTKVNLGINIVVYVNKTFNFPQSKILDKCPIFCHSGNSDARSDGDSDGSHTKRSDGSADARSNGNYTISANNQDFKSDDNADARSDGSHSNDSDNNADGSHSGNSDARSDGDSENAQKVNQNSVNYDLEKVKNNGTNKKLFDINEETEENKLTSAPNCTHTPTYTYVRTHTHTRDYMVYNYNYNDNNNYNLNNYNLSYNNKEKEKKEIYKERKEKENFSLIAPERKEKSCAKKEKTTVVKISEPNTILRVGDESLDLDKFKEYYNQFAKTCGLSTIITITDKRKKMLKQRIKDYGKSAIAQVLVEVQKSDFLLGRNSNGWRADFDFIYRADSFLKILEGKYRESDGLFQRENSKAAASMNNSVSDAIHPEQVQKRDDIAKKLNEKKVVISELGLGI